MIVKASASASEKRRLRRSTGGARQAMTQSPQAVGSAWQESQLIRYDFMVNSLNQTGDNF